jgi:hypothetical protein
MGSGLFLRFPREKSSLTRERERERERERKGHPESSTIAKLRWGEGETSRMESLLENRLHQSAGRSWSHS